ETIEGIVVDESGRPLAGVVVDAGPHSTDVFGHHAKPRTDARGRFQLARLGDDPATTPIVVEHPEYASVEPERRYPWGRHDIEIVMRRRAALDIEVVDQVTGAPVAAFRLRWCVRTAHWSRFSGVDDVSVT